MKRRSRVLNVAPFLFDGYQRVAQSHSSNVWLIVTRSVDRYKPLPSVKRTWQAGKSPGSIGNTSSKGGYSKKFPTGPTERTPTYLRVPLVRSHSMFDGNTIWMLWDMYITGYSEANSWKIDKKMIPFPFGVQFGPILRNMLFFLLFTPKINFKSPG